MGAVSKNLHFPPNWQTALNNNYFHLRHVTVHPHEIHTCSPICNCIQPWGGNPKSPSEFSTWQTFMAMAGFFGGCPFLNSGFLDEQG